MSTLDIRAAALATTALVSAAMLPQVAAAEQDYIGRVKTRVSTDTSDWTPWDWVTRYGTSPIPPSGFERLDSFQGRENVLQVSHRENDNLEPNDYEGQKIALEAGTTTLSGDLWIPESWRETGEYGDGDKRFQSVGLHGGDSTFPAFHFTNQGDVISKAGEGRLHVWEGGTAAGAALARHSSFHHAFTPGVDGKTNLGWVNLPDGEDGVAINYGGWNRLEIRLDAGRQTITYLLNGQVVYHWESPPEHSFETALSHAVLLGHNEDGHLDGWGYDHFWSNLVSGYNLVAGEAIGSTPGSVIIEPDDAAARTATVVDGATIGGDFSSKGGAAVHCRCGDARARRPPPDGQVHRYLRRWSHPRRR